MYVCVSHMPPMKMTLQAQFVNVGRVGEGSIRFARICTVAYEASPTPWRVMQVRREKAIPEPFSLRKPFQLHTEG